MVLTSSAEDLTPISTRTASSDAPKICQVDSYSTLSWRDKPIAKWIGFEFVLLFHGIAGGCMSVIAQNFLISRICQVSENFTESVCFNLTQYQADEKDVESVTSEYYMYQSLIETGLPILLSLFLGPWTDKYGNKPVILLSLSGHFVSSLLYIIIYYMPQLTPVYILMCSVPLAVTGGLASFVIAGFNLIVKQSDESSRSDRITIVGIFWNFGTLVGLLAAAKIYNTGGFLPVFIISSGFYGAAFLHTFVTVREEIPDSMNLNEDSSLTWLKDMCDMSSFKDTLTTCFKPRQGNKRKYILILGLVICVHLIGYCSLKYQYLFTRNEFGWDLDAYTRYSIITNVIGNIGSIVMFLIFLKLLKLSDMVLILIGSLSNIAGYVLYAMAHEEWQMYLGSGVQMLGSISSYVIRSMLSKLVPRDESGRLLSFITCVELAMPFLAGSFYGTIYMNTVIIFPGIIFFVAAGCNVINALFSLYLALSMRNPTNYVLVIEE